MNPKFRWIKIDHLRSLQRNNSGIILIVVLWLLVILTTLAVGLGRRTSIDLALTKHGVGKTKAFYNAWAGFIYSLNQIKIDTQDETTKGFDTLRQCGIRLDKGQLPEEIFKEISVQEGHFTVDLVQRNNEDETVMARYGFRDEESKVNLNALSLQNYKVLQQLIMLLGFEEDMGRGIAYSVIDWKDANDIVADAVYGAEDEYYTGLAKPYHCKNAALDSVEELLLIRGVTPQIYNQLKEYITIYPKNTARLKVNVDTAPEIVLRALGRSVAGQATNTELSDADSLAEKIVSFRRGSDDIGATADDLKVEMNDLGLNAKERSIYLASRGRMTDISNHLRMRIKGTDSFTRAQTNVEAVVQRNDLKILYWHRN